MQEDLTGKTYLLEIGPHEGHTATIIGKDPSFPGKDRWLVTAHGYEWGVAGIALRAVIEYQRNRECGISKA